MSFALAQGCCACAVSHICTSVRDAGLVRGLLGKLWSCPRKQLLHWPNVEACGRQADGMWQGEGLWVAGARIWLLYQIQTLISGPYGADMGTWICASHFTGEDLSSPIRLPEAYPRVREQMSPCTEMSSSNFFCCTGSNTGLSVPSQDRTGLPGWLPCSSDPIPSLLWKSLASSMSLGLYI